MVCGYRSGVDNDDIVDIDSYEDGDAQALRDSLQWEAASNPSPADSTSTSNSKYSTHRRTGYSYATQNSTCTT